MKTPTAANEAPHTYPLIPVALAGRIARLPTTIEAVDVALDFIDLPGYYDDQGRPTGVVTLQGAGLVGRGECVAWTARDQERFADAVPSLVARGSTTIGALSEALGGVEPYYRAAIEAAAIDLALRQADTNLFVLSGRRARPVSFCRSLGLEAIAATGGPAEAVLKLLAEDPAARIKIDVDPGGWSETAWAALAETGRLVVLDFKREGEVGQIALAHARLPGVWIEDPPPAALDTDAPWRGRISLDGYVRSARDLSPPPVVPGAVNVKPSRMGGPLEALRALEICARQGWAAYVGGMFEAGPGRPQARVLASLFTADAWNDLASLGAGPPESSPIPIPDKFSGFGYLD